MTNGRQVDGYMSLLEWQNINRNSFGLFVDCLGFFFNKKPFLLSIKLFSYLHQNPGFDFSGAEISGNYSKGGPDFSSLAK